MVKEGKFLLGKRIAQLRKKQGLSQYALAEKLGFSRGQLANYEQGQREPDFKTLQKIADYFDVSTDYLLGKTDIPNHSYNPIEEIEKITKDLGIKDLFFYDVEAWENFTEEDVEELKKHFEWVAHKARERNKGEGR